MKIMKPGMKSSCLFGFKIAEMPQYPGRLNTKVHSPIWIRCNEGVMKDIKHFNIKEVLSTTGHFRTSRSAQHIWQIKSFDSFNAELIIIWWAHSWWAPLHSLKIQGATCSYLTSLIINLMEKSSVSFSRINLGKRGDGKFRRLSF